LETGELIRVEYSTRFRRSVKQRLGGRGILTIKPNLSVVWRRRREGKK
jgi:hypothetical protein